MTNNTNNTIRIIAAVVDVHNLTLYKSDGETLIIPQGDSRVRPIVEEITPLLISQGYAEIHIRASDVNAYAQFEEQSTGLVKFFRVAKDRLKNLFAKEAKEPVLGMVPPLSVGPVPTPAIEQADQKKAGYFTPLAKTKATQAMAAVTEILQHAVSVSSPEFHENTVAKQGDIADATGYTNKSTADTPEADTIIAVMGNTIIPGVEKIKTQFARATKMGSTLGVENFLKRLGTVIEHRSHSVEDLLKFMERADLPIADDGSILIYKVLARKGEKYVDCHTKQVEQWVGAYVCMDPSLVDHNRNNECSNGLHVARRGYIREFSGDVCIMAKLAPEDVIAVPAYDANKMRVCGYHILMELTAEQYELLKHNRPITDNTGGRVLLAAALVGNHIQRTHEVRITGHKGNGVVVTALTRTTATKPVITPAAPKEAATLDNLTKEIQDIPVQPKDVIQRVEQAQQLSRKEQAAKLYADYQFGEPGALEALQAFKKAAKVGWDRLGITDPVVTGSAAAMQIPTPVAIKGKGKTKTKAKKHGKDKTKPIQFTTPKTVPDVFKDTAGPVVQSVVLDGSEDRRGEVYDENTTGSPRERIQKLLAIGLTSIGVAQAIVLIKQRSKKSWSVLGVTADQLDQILKLANTNKG